MLTSAELTSRLREAGFKVTPQRLAVYNMLSHTKAHPNADTIYKELQPLYPTMSLATVYKALAILCDLGLAQELNVGEEAFRYDADTSHHPHIRCTCCGRVDDVEVDLPSSVAESLGKATAPGFTITGYKLLFCGLCSACAQERQE